MFAPPPPNPHQNNDRYCMRGVAGVNTSKEGELEGNETRCCHIIMSMMMRAMMMMVMMMMMKTMMVMVSIVSLPLFLLQA